jgi:LmbE family N-acetylglucosaminyl deacetylase
MTPVVLAVLAHPDDAEFLCAGTLVRLHRERGWAAHVATMTAGDCGSAEHAPDAIAAIRRSEGKAACDAVGFTYHCLEVLDLRVRYCDEQLEKVCRLLNAVRPQVVLTHSPADYHMDHEQTSTLVRAATFAAPIPNFLHRPTSAGPHAEPHPPLDAIPHLFYCDPLEGKDLFGRPVPPAFSIDITAAIDAKADMLAAHESQRAWLRKHHGVDSLLDSMRAWSAAQGGRCGVAYAEGFRQHLGHSYPQSNVLADLLGAV